jgi:signal peptidase I
MDNSKAAKASRAIKKGLRFLGVLLIIVLGTWLFKAVLFSVYYIPSGSMLPTLHVGDYVLVSKFPYNLRTPEYYPLTDIPFPFASANGVGQVQRGDIVVFDLPLFPSQLHPAQKEDYIKRVVGIPGDTIMVSNMNYYLRSANDPNDIPDESLVITTPIPHEKSWISLADSTKKYWESVLLRDGNSITYDSSGNVHVNSKKKTRYQVRQNYYFVQGDNINLSSDSRNWGLVPESYLIGRAEAILWPWPPCWL